MSRDGWARLKSTMETCNQQELTKPMADLDVSSSESFLVNKQKKKALLQKDIVKRAGDQGVLLIKLKDLPPPSELGTILTDRQKEWVQTASYNTTLHNPVFYKYSCEATKSTNEEVEEARAAVRGLADKPLPQLPSGIAEMIYAKKKASHMQLTKQLEEELITISSNLEHCVQEASDIANSKLTENVEVEQRRRSGRLHQV